MVLEDRRVTRSVRRGVESAVGRKMISNVNK
jgi:hypothetical protein